MDGMNCCLEDSHFNEYSLILFSAELWFGSAHVKRGLAHL